MCIRVLCNSVIVLALLVVSLPAIAQTTGSVTPGKAVGPSQDEPPPGGCMPLGITAAGETVFPYACKGFIEAAKGKTPTEVQEREGQPESKPVARAAAASAPNTALAPAIGAVAAPLVKETSSPEAQEKIVAKPEEPAILRAEETAPLKREQRPTRRAGAPPNCVQFRTFDSVTGMYRDPSGNVRPCTSGKP